MTRESIGSVRPVLATYSTQLTEFSTVLRSMAGQCKYSCETATQTLEWIHAIVDFIRPYASFINAHVVNFFQDRLWEAVDKEWIDCLRKESVENLLLIPSGVVQDYWPASLKEFIVALKSLVLPREQADLQMVYPELHMTSLNNVVTLGMNLKKKHEVENLSAVVSSIANSLGANTIVDVGSGQGYLAQVLSFEYHHSVVAIDACSHLGNVTEARAERIKKYYAAKLRQSNSGIKSLNVPKTITCRVMSIDMLKSLTDKSTNDDDFQQCKSIAQDHEKLDLRKPQSCNLENEDSIVLAGLHACGDLSVTMLKTFSECKNVKAVVSIGCCYNLLSEQGSESDDSQYGFPLSCGVKSAGLLLGRNARDLACQSAERWKSLGKEAGLHNFELHAFRAAFQMVLCKYYPEVVVASPSIGRQGKTLRRQQQRRILQSSLHRDENTISKLSQNQCIKRGSCPTPTIRHEERKTEDTTSRMLEKDDSLHDISSNGISESEGTKFINKFSRFEKFCQSGLCRLSLKPLQDVDLLGIWEKAEPFIDLIGPYWSLRAAFGPLLETFILLDRLLFLQEQGTSFEVAMLPIFDPALSPRNVAIIAKRRIAETYSVL